MGKTVRTVTDSYYKEFGRIAPFKKAITKRDKLILDMLQSYVHHHKMAIMSAAPELPMQFFILSMNVEQQNQLQEIDKRLDELERKLRK